MTRCQYLPISLFASVLLLVSAGCQMGPSALKTSRAQYNEAVQTTADEQLLLNLVRLKYRDSPVFLQIGSISTQFVLEHSADISGSINENVGAQPINANTLRLGGAVGYSEKPTITFTPLTGDDFVTRMLAPLAIERLALLVHSGWSIDRVFRVAVQEMNGLDNAARASGPTPTDVPDFVEFARATELLRELQANRTLHLERESRPTIHSDPIPAPTADALIPAAANGKSFRQTEAGWVLTGSSQHLIARLTPEAIESDTVQELVATLNLIPGQSQYDLVAARQAHGGELDDAGHHIGLALDTRSLLGMMFYLSQAIEVPQKHIEDNLVTTTTTPNNETFDWSQVAGDLLQVHHQRTHPSDAIVAVKYRGYWFYISDNDLNSKSTFALLGQLFNLQAGTAASGGPALTLPIGG